MVRLTSWENKKNEMSHHRLEHLKCMVIIKCSIFSKLDLTMRI